MSDTQSEPMSEADLEAILSRCGAAKGMVSRLCRGVRWEMSVPASYEHDSDLVIVGSLRDIPGMTHEIRRLWAESKRLEESLAFLRTTSPDTPDLWLDQLVTIGPHPYKIVTIDGRNREVGTLISAVRVD